MLRWGPESGPVVVIALPLLEEANRTRAFLVEVMRRLASERIGSAVPDLPGQGESVVPTVNARFGDWCEAFAAAVTASGPNAFIVAVRGGTLIDGEAESANRLHFSPVPGATLVRDLLRTRRAVALAGGEKVVADDLDQTGPPLLLAGNLIDRSLLQALTRAAPTEAARVLTVVPEAGAGGLAPPDDGNREARPRYRRPWLTTEANVDFGLAKALAADITQWVRACEGC